MANRKGRPRIASMAIFLVYLIVPDSGLGGNQVRVRFAWVVFLLGVPLVSSAARLQPLERPSLCSWPLPAFNLAQPPWVSSLTVVQVEDYLGTLRDLRPGATIIAFGCGLPNQWTVSDIVDLERSALALGRIRRVPPGVPGSFRLSSAHHRLPGYLQFPARPHQTISIIRS